jgi:hypothetical protein
MAMDMIIARTFACENVKTPVSSSEARVFLCGEQIIAKMQNCIIIRFTDPSTLTEEVNMGDDNGGPYHRTDVRSGCWPYLALYLASAGVTAVVTKAVVARFRKR